MRASKVTGPGLLGSRVGSTTWLTIKACNDQGRFLGRGGFPFWVTVAATDFPASEAVPVTLRDNEDGTFSVSYEPRVHGAHRVTVGLGDPDAVAHVDKSPYVVAVERGPGAQPGGGAGAAEHAGRGRSADGAAGGADCAAHCV